MGTLALDLAADRTREEERTLSALLALSSRAYQLAARVLDSPHEAEDAVQQAYLHALNRPPKEVPAEEVEVWFLRVVANAAKKHLRGEARRRRREAAVESRPVDRSLGPGQEPVSVLRGALAALEERYRVPLALCYEQGLTQRQAAAVLEMPERTVSKYVGVGLEKLRRALARAGYAAMPAVVLAGLKQTAPAVPATLGAALEKLVAGQAAAVAAGAAGGGGALAGGAAAVLKGGVAMKAIAGLVAAGALAGAVAVSGGALGRRSGPPASAGEAKLPPVNPYNGRQERENVFEFAQKPNVKKQGDKYVISFASKGRCDATVGIVDGKGRIVRHLASGVLGPNAPHPFGQNSLSQRIEWDGLDDRGKPAPAGCRVRVSLGLKPRLDRFLGESLSFSGAGSGGLACDKHGQVYAMSGLSVRVFDREARYLRTIMPAPANVPAERMALIQWTKTSWGGQTVFRPRSGGSSTFDLFGYPGFGRAFGAQVPAVTPDGRLLLVSGPLAVDRGVNARKLFILDTRDGAVPKENIVALEKGGREGGALGDSGVPSLAVSPDGRTLYLSGLTRPGDPRWKKMPITAVFRVSLERPGDAKPFAGDPKAGGKDNAHFSFPRGLACDKAGNVYVCDQGNDRVQVFKPDGAFLKSLPVESPYQVAVYPKTGAVYVLGAVRVNWGNKPDPKGMCFRVTLFELGGLASPAVRAKLEFPKQQHRHTHTMCLDPSSEPAALWLAGVPTWGLSRVEPRGNKFEKTLDAAQYGGRPEGWEKWQPGAKGCYIAADPVREELYVREGDNCFPDPVLRVDGRTGKLIERFPYQIEQVYVASDGAVWMRFSDGGQWLVRYDPAAGQFVPLSAPGARQAVTGGYGDKNKEGKGHPLSHKGKPVVGVYVPANFGARTWQDFFGVAPNGDVYVPAGLLQQHIEELQKAGEPHPPKPGGCSHCVLRVYAPEGTLKCASAIPGLGHSNGVRVGRSGAVYAVFQCHPAGQKVPEGIAPDGKYECDEWGTLVKFRSAFGSFPVGKVAGRWGDAAAGEPTHYWGAQYGIGKGGAVRIENMHWDYGGASPITQGGCTCMRGYFDLDGFERVFLPALQTCTVNVLDANGNIVLRLGGYGNVDSRGADSPVVDPETGLLRPRRPDDSKDLASPLAEPEIALSFPRFTAVTDEALYVHDAENSRIVRARLEYEAEETVGLDGSSAGASAPAASRPAVPRPASDDAAPTGKPAVAAPAAPDPEMAARGLWSLAMSYKRAGRADKAREYLAKVIEAYPESGYAARARRELAGL